MSHHQLFRTARRIGDWPRDVPITMTVVCRRNPAYEHERLIAECERAAPHERRVWRGREFDDVFGSRTDEMGRVATALERHGFTVRRSNRRSRLITIRGNARAVARAFGVTLGRFDVHGTVRRGHEQPARVRPASLEPLVEAVLGLDDLPIVSGPHVTAAPSRRGQTYTPDDLIRFYRFPAELGDGEVVGLAQLAGGFDPADPAAYFKRANVRRTMPTTTGRNLPASREAMQHLVSWMNGSGPHAAADDLDATRWTFENTLDIELAGVFAPRAALHVVFAGSDDETGAIGAIRKLLHGRPRPTVVSLSWSLTADHQRSSSSSGKGLKSAHQLLEDAFKEAMLLGTTVCCASGDQGSNGDDSSGRTLQVDYPAASAYVLACGGTTLAAHNGRPSSEKVWNARTSGIHFASGGGLQVGAGGAGAPAWQVQALEAWARKTRDHHAPLTSIERGVPDVACNADFNTGCQLIVAGVEARAGGTSASAPIWAALVARLNSALRKKTDRRIGFANPAFYSSASAFNNIGTGYNNMSDPTGPYRAVRGTWDPCTGLGTPRGDALLAALEQLHRSASPSKGRVSHK